MAYEDFTTFTESDEGSDVTVENATKVSWINLRTKDQTAYLYKDKGVNHFAGDFTHKFEIQFSNVGDQQTCTYWMLSNIIGDRYQLPTQNEDGYTFVLYDDIEQIAVGIYEGGAYTSDSWAPPGPQSSTVYFIEIVRDDDGGANNTGRLTTYIRTGSHTGALQDTLIVDASAGEQNDFRYIYALATYDHSADTTDTDGFTQNLDLGAPSTGDLNVTLPIITAQMYDEGLHADLNATLPIITADLKSGGAINATLPMITAGIKSFNDGNLDTTLPVITAEITGFAGTLGEIDSTLPLITADMLGGNGGFLDATLPLITTEMKSGAQLDVTLPAMTAEGYGYAGEVGGLTVSLPKIEAESTGKVEVLGDLDATLPVITARMKGLAGRVMSLDAVLPMVTAGLAGYQEITGDLNVTIPMIESRMVGTIEREVCDVLRYSEPEL